MSRANSRLIPRARARGFGRLGQLMMIAALFGSILVAIPTAANAQIDDWSVEIGTYSVPDNDGSVDAALTLSPAGTALAAVRVQLDYDPSLVSVTSCDIETDRGDCLQLEPGRLMVNAVTGDLDGWNEDFVMAGIGLQALGVDAMATLDLTIIQAYDSTLTDVAAAGEAFDGQLTINSRAPAAGADLACADGDGVLEATFDNPMDDPVTFIVTADGIEPASFTLDPITEATETVAGIPDVRTAAVNITTDEWGTLFEREFEVRCDPEVVAAVQCGDGGGTVFADVVNYSGSFATYRLTVGNDSQQRSISDSLRTAVTFGPFTDGDQTVTATRNGAVIFEEVIAIDCGIAAPEPTPTPVPEPEPTPTPMPVEPEPTPTPLPVDPDPEPDPEPLPASDEVQIVVTCLGGNGRVDHNIVNTTGANATYRVEFGALAPRQFMVAAGDWRRQPITGRPDDEHRVVVTRDDEVIVDEMVTVACDGEENEIDEPEVQIVNACRNGLGYVIFQFANLTDESRSWVIEWGELRNRSTTAAGRAGAVKAVTGRPSGTYDARVRVGGEYVANLTIEVNCG